MPLDVISELLNIPHEYRESIHVLSDRVGARGEGVDVDQVIVASAELFELYLGLIQERRAKPQDDIINVIMNTEVTDDEDGKTRRMSDTKPRSASSSWVLPDMRRSPKASRMAASR